jgi:hypothetical protein
LGEKWLKTTIILWRFTFLKLPYFREKVLAFRQNVVAHDSFNFSTFLYDV